MAVGVKCAAADNMVTKSLDNIVGNLWQQRQESSGSSVGNQSPRNGEDLSDGEAEATSPPVARESSPEDSLGGQVRVKDPRDLIKEDHVAEKELDPRSILANLPPLPALEAFNKHRDFLTSPQSLLSAAGLGGGLRVPPVSAASMLGLQPPLNTFAPLPPARPPSQPTTPSSQQSSSPVHQNFSSQQNWSFEEQFKQLYEIDDNPKRKEFLDELFTLMQKRGTPINRLPIMAKQVLDLYELYNLVCARGGLVEVINKKLWQEVIKGLGLPSSITSAAFTLRTQYTKYLYPYECLKRNLSNPNELQAAIEGNKREGRRGSYGTYPEMGLPPHPGLPSQISPMSLVTGGPGGRGFNANGTSHPMPPTSRSPGGPHDPLSALEMTRLALWKMYNQAGGGGSPPVSLPNLPGLPADLLQHAAAAHHQQQQQDKALNMQMERQQRAIEAAAQEAAVNAAVAAGNRLNHDNDNDKDEPSRERVPSRSEQQDDEDAKEGLDEEINVERNNGDSSVHDTSSLSPPPLSSRKRHRSHDSDDLVEDVTPKKQHPLGLPGANIKIASRGDGRNGDSSLVVSLEINGTTYQGVLFAQPTSKHRAS